MKRQNVKKKFNIKKAYANRDKSQKDLEREHQRQINNVFLTVVSVIIILFIFLGLVFLTH